MTRCKAITNGYKAHPCRNNAKYGDFCGMHSPKEPVPESQLCHGITLCGEKCRRSVKRGQFCNFHMFPVHPDHDWVELSLYRPDVHWPWMANILNHIKKVNSTKELEERMGLYERIFVRYTNLFDDLPISTEQKIESQNRYVIYLMESFFVNYYLDFNTQHWQNVVSVVSSFTEKVSFLKDYRELFRKKFDNTYRHNTQKRYTELVLANSKLGSDLAEKIVSFL